MAESPAGRRPSPGWFPPAPRPRPRRVRCRCRRCRACRPLHKRDRSRGRAGTARDRSRARSRRGRFADCARAHTRATAAFYAPRSWRTCRKARGSKSGGHGISCRTTTPRHARGSPWRPASACSARRAPCSCCCHRPRAVRAWGRHREPWRHPWPPPRRGRRRDSSRRRGTVPQAASAMDASSTANRRRMETSEAVTGYRFTARPRSGCGAVRRVPARPWRSGCCGCSG